MDGLSRARWSLGRRGHGTAEAAHLVGREHVGPRGRVSPLPGPRSRSGRAAGRSRLFRILKGDGSRFSARGRKTTPAPSPCVAMGDGVSRVWYRSYSVLFESWRRSTPFDVSRGRQRSPTSATRPGSVRIVKSRVSKPSSISFQVTGVDAPANSLARALYAHASDFPSMFCR